MSKSVAVKITIVAVVAIVAAGCSNTQRRTGTGALIGAGTGAVIGGIAGGGTGAAWGAGIGAVAGGAIGAATAN